MRLSYLFDRTGASRWLRLTLAALLAVALGTTLLVGLALAQDEEPTPRPTPQPAPALTSPAAIGGGVSIVPDTPDSSLPPEGRIIGPTAAPQWIVDLQQRAISAGVATDELIVAKVGPTEAFNGAEIFYTITLTNTSDSVTLRNVALRDVLPRGALTDLRCIANTCEQVFEEREIPEPLGGVIVVTETRELSWTVAAIAPGTSATRRFAGRIVGLADGAEIKNQAFANYALNGERLAASSNEVQTIVRVRTEEGVGAAISKAPNWFSSDRGGTLGLDWGDFDRDGDLDLALASSVGTTIYRNDDGVLRRLWSNTRRTFGVRWGDFTGDGRLELIAVGDQSGAEGLNYLYTISGNTVQEAQRFTSTAQLVRAGAGDFNGDGTLDLIVSTNIINAPCPVLLYTNDGTGKLTPSSTCISRRATASIGVGDIDNDGALDLVLGLFPNSVQLFRNDGAGNFGIADGSGGRRPSFPVDNSTSFLPYDFAWGDYDGDGYLDLAAAYPLLRQARIYRNLGGSGFADPIILRTDRFLTPFSLDWGDFTGDGRLDLAVGDLAPTVYSFDGTNFVRQALLTTNGLSGQVWALRGVDVDQDGDLDLTITNRDGPSFIFTNFAPVLSQDLQIVPTNVDVARAAAADVLWADLNGDGSFDLLFAAGENEVSSKRYLNQQGSFDREDEATLSGFGPHSIAVGDVDGDGALDIAIGTAQNIQIFLAGNIGAADWTSDPLSARVTDMAWGDFDDDGDLDLLVATAGEGVLLYRNNAAGPGIVGLTPSPIWRSTARFNATAVAWADVTNDFYLDFAVAVDGGNNLVFLNQLIRNAGVVAFEQVAWTPAVTNDPTRDIAWVDYDGDGDFDLSVANYGQPILIYGNVSSAGRFALTTQPVWQSSTFSRTVAIDWGDVDNDGDLDLAVANDGEADQLFINRQGQLFWLWSSPDIQSTTGVAFGDVDNDGDLDLAVSQDGGGRNGFYENMLVLPAHLGDEYAAGIPRQFNLRYLSVARPGTASDAYGMSTPEILSGPKQGVVSIRYQLYDPNGLRNSPGSNAPGQAIPLSLLRYEYSLDGGGTWRTATSATVISPTEMITPTRLGTAQTFMWNAQADRALSEDARFRVRLVQPDETGPVSSAMTAAVSPPFRVRATTCLWPTNVRIMSTPANPSANETVRLTAVIQASGVISASWNLGDGRVFSGQRVDHRYLYDGTYNVTLSVQGESCPRTRIQIISSTVRIGTGVLPLFLPFVSRDTGAARTVTNFEESASQRLLPLPGPAVIGFSGAEDETGAVVLRWADPPTPEPVISYRIYRSDDNGDFVPWDQVGATERSYRDLNATCGVAYFVTAMGRGGEGPVSDSTYYTTPCGGAE
ncbi:PKD domain-containing protein [bacterium]|nr:PKD domain-containing protein [bacterium]